MHRPKGIKIAFGSLDDATHPAKKIAEEAQMTTKKSGFTHSSKYQIEPQGTSKKRIFSRDESGSCSNVGIFGSGAESDSGEIAIFASDPHTPDETTRHADTIKPKATLATDRGYRLRLEAIRTAHNTDDSELPPASYRKG